MKKLLLVGLLALAACAPPASNRTTEIYSPLMGNESVSLPSRWEKFSRFGSIVTMPNGCQWIHWRNARSAVMTPYTGPDGRQVCVEPLQ